MGIIGKRIAGCQSGSNTFTDGDDLDPATGERIPYFFAPAFKIVAVHYQQPTVFNARVIPRRQFVFMRFGSGRGEIVNNRLVADDLRREKIIGVKRSGDLDFAVHIPVPIFIFGLLKYVDGDNDRHRENRQNQRYCQFFFHKHNGVITQLSCKYNLPQPATTGKSDLWINATWLRVADRFRPADS